MLRPDQIERVYQTTDALLLHRDWVVVPLDAVARPAELVMPDGKLLIHAPGGPAFDAWLQGLPGRLEALDLRRVPRLSERDPKWPLTGPGSPRFEGTMRYLRGGVPSWRR
ncbi:MAG TPA: hypothetical protein VF950_03315 [Planctomycetota bacterium]